MTEIPVTSIEGDIAAEKKRIWKNIILISIGFLLTFNAFQGLSRLQSSLHRVDGMGVINSSVLYGALVISCLFLPKLTTRAIGHKWPIPLCFLFYIIWMGANGYAVWGTMLPASILVGLAAAPLWTSQCSYFTKVRVRSLEDEMSTPDLLLCLYIAQRYAELDGKSSEEAVLSKFFGVFFMFFQMSGITGSIISFTVLKTTATESNLTDSFMAESCGRNDCPWNNSTNLNLEKPESRTVWMMVIVYIGIALASVAMLAVFVDQLPSDLRSRRAPVCEEIGDLVKATVVHLKHKIQILLIPLTIYSGLEQGFFNAEFNKSYVSCSMGIWKVGLVMLPFGCVDAITSFVCGQVVRYTGRIPVFLTAAICDVIIQVILASYSPSNTNHYVVFIISAMWGFTDGIWQTQINALYGTLFPNTSEAAFSNYRMWESIGFIMAFSYSNYLCTSVKLYILMTCLGFGIIGYAIVEAYYQQLIRDVDLPVSPADIGMRSTSQTIETINPDL